jgi:hypothetical protein
MSVSILLWIKHKYSDFIYFRWQWSITGLCLTITHLYSSVGVLQPTNKKSSIGFLQNSNKKPYIQKTVEF